MPRHHYDRHGNYRGYSLSDRERDRLKLHEIQEWRQRHKNDARDQATFDRGCLVLVAIAAVVGLVALLISEIDERNRLRRNGRASATADAVWQKLEYEVVIPAHGYSEWDVRRKPFIGWYSDPGFWADVYYADQQRKPVRQRSVDPLRPTSVDKVVMFNVADRPLKIRFWWYVRTGSDDPRSALMTVNEQ